MLKKAYLCYPKITWGTDMDTYKPEFVTERPNYEDWDKVVEIIYAEI